MDAVTVPIELYRQAQAHIQELQQQLKEQGAYYLTTIALAKRKNHEEHEGHKETND